MRDTENNAVQVPIDGTLDLHMFSPKDAASLVHEYVQACLEKGIYEITIVHGKGKGVLRRTVHSILKKHPHVLRFSLDPGPSSWGATRVLLKD